MLNHSWGPGGSPTNCFLFALFRERRQRFLLEFYFSLGMTRIGTVPAGTRVRQVLLRFSYVEAHQVVWDSGHSSSISSVWVLMSPRVYGWVCKVWCLGDAYMVPGGGGLSGIELKRGVGCVVGGCLTPPPLHKIIAVGNRYHPALVWNSPGFKFITSRLFACSCQLRAYLRMTAGPMRIALV